MGKINIFLSYKREDEKTAADICNHFSGSTDIKIHRDVIDIGSWRSIKEFMQSIADMDYIIMLISEKYLESDNCMYEVLEVMRDRRYAEKIFPAVLCEEIYKPIERVKYVKFWEEKFDELNTQLQQISLQNISSLSETLKLYQNIALNIDEFLGKVADLNNPEISSVALRIEEKLREYDLCSDGEDNRTINSIAQTEDVFQTLGIPRNNIYREPTDLEINSFIEESYKTIITLLRKISNQYQRENESVVIKCDQLDSRTNIFRFYIEGKLVREIKIFMINMFGRTDNIAISDNINNYGGGNSYNGIYSHKTVNGELKLEATLSMIHNQEVMTVEEVVKNIWIDYVQRYL